MAYNPFIKQAGTNNLQGSSGSALQGGINNLQGSSGASLQGGASNIQGPSMSDLNAIKNPTPKPAQVQALKSKPATTAIKPPVAQRDLSADYGLTDIGGNQTVVRKKNNFAFSEANPFLQEVGAQDFNNLKFDTSYKYNPTPAVPPQQNDAGTQKLSEPNTPAAGTMPTPPNVNDQYAALKNSYINAIKNAGQISPEEQALSDQLIQFQGDARQGVSNVEGQGRGIPLNLVRGEQSKLLEQANIQEQTLQQRLANLQAQNQAKRSADVQAAQAELGFAQEGQKPIEVGGSLVKLNPATGKYEAVYGGSPKYTEVGAGGTLIDPATGKVIFQGAPKPENLPASAQEYEYAVKNGYKGTYQQYQNEDANRKAPRISVNGGGGNGLTPYQELQAVLNIQGKLSSGTNDAREAIGRFSQASSAYDSYRNGAIDKNGLEQVVVNSFNKILDPASVVREGEYARSADGQSLLNRADGYFHSLAYGGSLSDVQIKELIDAAGVLVQRYQQEVEARNKQAIDTANQFGLPSNLIGVGNYGGAPSGGQSGAAANTGDPLNLGI